MFNAIQLQRHAKRMQKISEFESVAKKLLHCVVMGVVGTSTPHVMGLIFYKSPSQHTVPTILPLHEASCLTTPSQKLSQIKVQLMSHVS